MVDREGNMRRKFQDEDREYRAIRNNALEDVTGRVEIDGTNWEGPVTTFALQQKSFWEYLEDQMQEPFMYYDFNKVPEGIWLSREGGRKFVLNQLKEKKPFVLYDPEFIFSDPKLRGNLENVFEFENRYLIGSAGGYLLYHRSFGTPASARYSRCIFSDGAIVQKATDLFAMGLKGPSESTILSKTKDTFPEEYLRCLDLAMTHTKYLIEQKAKPRTVGLVMDNINALIEFGEKECGLPKCKDNWLTLGLRLDKERDCSLSRIRKIIDLAKKIEIIRSQISEWDKKYPLN